MPDNFDEIINPKDISQNPKPTYELHIFKRLKYDQNTKNKNILKENNFKEKQYSLPENYDLLNATGVNFSRYRKEASKYYMPYELALTGKFGNFIKSGFRTIITEGKGGKLNFQEKPFNPSEKIKYTSTRCGDYGNKIYSFNPETQNITINIDYPSKGEAFVKSNLERYTYKGSYLGKDRNLTLKKGFCTEKYDKNNKCISREYGNLYDGTILMLSDDVISSVTHSNPNLIYKGSKDCKHPHLLSKIAKFIRDFTNENNLSSQDYDYKKDTLIYDLFVSGNLNKTRSVFDAKTRTGSLDLLNDFAENMINNPTLETVNTFEAYMKWIEDIQK